MLVEEEGNKVPTLMMYSHNSSGNVKVEEVIVILNSTLVGMVNNNNNNNHLNHPNSLKGKTISMKSI